MAGEVLVADRDLRVPLGLSQEEQPVVDYLLIRGEKGQDLFHHADVSEFIHGTEKYTTAAGATRGLACLRWQ